MAWCQTCLITAALPGNQSYRQQETHWDRSEASRKCSWGLLGTPKQEVQVETKEITIRYMETFFKGKSKSDQILEQVAKKSCEISSVGKKAEFTWERTWATWSNCNCSVQRVGLDELQRTLTNQAVFIWVDDSPGCHLLYRDHLRSMWDAISCTEVIQGQPALIAWPGVISGQPQSQLSMQGVM